MKKHQFNIREREFWKQAYIEEHDARIEDIRRGSINWISVKDRLPENAASVLIYTKDGGIAEGSYLRGEGWLQFRWSVKDARVTHWMPLSEPPKEG